MTKPDEGTELAAFEARLRRAFASVSAPPRRAVPKRWAWPGALAAVGACLLIVAVAVGLLLGTGWLSTAPRTRTPSSTVWHGHGLTITARADAAKLSCRLPVDVLATGVSGFIEFTDTQASFEPDSSAGQAMTYLPVFGRWVDIFPQDVSPDGHAYVKQDSRGEATVVRSDGSSQTFTVPSGASVFAWSREGVLLLINGDSSGPMLTMVLLDPVTGSVRPLALAPQLNLQSGPGSSQLSYLPGDDSLWGVRQENGATVISSQSIASGMTQTWFEGVGIAYPIATTSAGDPIIQIGSQDLGHLQPNQQNGVQQRVLLFASPDHTSVLNQGAVGRAGIAAGLSPLSVTDGGTVWMADDQGGIWTYSANKGMQEVAHVQTSEDGPPGISLSGPCA